MIVKPKTRGFICTTAHPVGCARHVADQIAYVKAQGAMTGCKNVLVVGCSTGFGLATRIAAAFGCGAKTIGVSYDHPASGKRTGNSTGNHLHLEVWKGGSKANAVNPRGYIPFPHN